LATNGMLMEGYGLSATGMGGASMAHDTGSAVMLGHVSPGLFWARRSLRRLGGERLDGFAGPCRHAVRSRFLPNPGVPFSAVTSRPLRISSVVSTASTAYEACPGWVRLISP
jgi:hypothetical protein